MLEILKKLYYLWRVKRDQNFLVNEGIRKAKENGLELKFGDQELALANPAGEMNLPVSEEGVDVTELIALVADDYPKVSRRYLRNKEKLNEY